MWEFINWWMCVTDSLNVLEKKKEIYLRNILPISIKTGIQFTAKIPGGGYALLSVVE